MRAIISTLTVLLLLAAVNTANAGTVTGTLIPPSDATLKSFTLVLGPVFGQGQEVPIGPNGEFTVQVSGIEHTALQVRNGTQIINTSLLFGLGDGTATFTLKVVPTSTRPPNAYKQSYYVDAERSYPNTMPDLSRHQKLIDESTVAYTNHMHLARLPMRASSEYLREAEEIYSTINTGEGGDQRSVDVAYCVSTLSLLDLATGDEIAWVEPFLEDLPTLLAPDDPAWALCATAAWALDEYAREVPDLPAYRDHLFEQHPVLQNRLVMMFMSTIYARDEGDQERVDTLLHRMKELDKEGSMVEMTTKLVAEQRK